MTLCNEKRLLSLVHMSKGSTPHDFESIGGIPPQHLVLWDYGYELWLSHMEELAWLVGLLVRLNCGLVSFSYLSWLVYRVMIIFWNIGKLSPLPSIFSQKSISLRVIFYFNTKEFKVVSISKYEQYVFFLYLISNFLYEIFLM